MREGGLLTSHSRGRQTETVKIVTNTYHVLEERGRALVPREIALSGFLFSDYVSICNVVENDRY